MPVLLRQRSAAAYTGEPELNLPLLSILYTGVLENIQSRAAHTEAILEGRIQHPQRTPPPVFVSPPLVSFASRLLKASFGVA